MLKSKQTVPRPLQPSPHCPRRQPCHHLERRLCLHSRPGLSLPALWLSVSSASVLSTHLCCQLLLVGAPGPSVQPWLDDRVASGWGTLVALVKERGAQGTFQPCQRWLSSSSVKSHAWSPRSFWCQLQFYWWSVTSKASLPAWLSQAGCGTGDLVPRALGNPPGWGPGHSFSLACPVAFFWIH